MKKKLKFIVPIPILLVVVAAAYMFLLAPKKALAKPPKVDGTLVQLAPEFIINLAGGHYGKLTMALLLSKPPVAAASATAAVVLPEDSVIRSVITDQLTGHDPSELTGRASRHDLLARLLKTLKASTDEPITKVLITDLAVQ
ncbi:MAG: flagellar basal body-associated FliL family protein [Actinomycetia bacterium]|jgi:flagellar basal body-associated protein FliL|nr:flagellar basal body-associated FliL family protein [Actinomycetes bacterium]